MSRLACIVCLATGIGCAPLVDRRCGATAADRSVDPTRVESERRARLARAGEDFDASVVGPFVIVSNGGPRVLGAATTTVARVRDGVRGDLFAKEPAEPVTIWVYGDTSTFVEGTASLGAPIPRTSFYTYTYPRRALPFGFYDVCARQLFVNTGEGQRALVHELVHVYVNLELPDPPTWIDEGLASLLQDDELDAKGHLRGRAASWMLSTLGRAIRAGTAPSLERVARAGRAELDGDEGARFYAASRYLLYWLQREGLLLRYWRALPSRRSDDPNGLALLLSTMGRDLPRLQREWEAFVLALWTETFPVTRSHDNDRPRSQ